MKPYTHLVTSLFLISGVASASVSSRTDMTQFIRAGYNLNEWQEPVFCDPGTYVSGFTLAIEKTSASKGLYSIRDLTLGCSSLNGENFNAVKLNPGFPKSSESWGNYAPCPAQAGQSSHAVGFTTSNEVIVNGNYASSYLSLTCNDYDVTSIETDNESDAKKNTIYQNACKINEAICGVKLGIYTTFPGSIGMFEFACCAL